MSIKYNNTDTKQVLFNDQIVKQLIINGSVAYCEQYNLKVNLTTGVKSITVLRTSTLEPSAATGILSDGAVIYYGDELEINATAESGYKLNRTYPQTITVSKATTINATATLDMVIQAPTITITSSQETLGLKVSITFSNPNSKQMTCYYTYELPILGESQSSTITVKGGGSNTTYKNLASGQGIVKGTVTAYLELREDTKTYKSETVTKAFSIRS